MLSARRTVTRQVTHDDLATTRYPTVCKPPVLASARLLEWCEQVVMELLGGCVVGSEMTIEHVSPAVLGSSLVIDAQCVYVDGPLTCWEIHVDDALGAIAVVIVVFHSIDMERYTERRIQPKLDTIGL